MTLLLVAFWLGISPPLIALTVAHLLTVIALVLVAFSTAFPG